jgi:hypothetical protein
MELFKNWVSAWQGFRAFLGLGNREGKEQLPDTAGPRLHRRCPEPLSFHHSFRGLPLYPTKLRLGSNALSHAIG